jgi:hypothetical protein
MTAYDLEAIEGKTVKAAGCSHGHSVTQEKEITSSII